MVQSACRPSLLFEAPQPVAILAEERRKNFDRDIPLQPFIPRSIHLAHATRADETDNLIRPESSAGWDRCVTLFDDRIQNRFSSFYGWSRQKSFRDVGGGQKRQGLTAKFGVLRSSPANKRFPLGLRHRQSRSHELLELLPPLRSHVKRFFRRELPEPFDDIQVG